MPKILESKLCIDLPLEFIGYISTTYVFGNREGMMFLMHAKSNMDNIIVKVLLVADNYDFIVLFYLSHPTRH